MNENLKNNLRELAKAGRILARNGHEDMTLGHVALRDPSGRGIWMKMRGIALGEIQGEDDFLLVDWDGQVLAGEGQRHSEWPIHTEIFRMRNDVNASVHSHPRYGTLLSAMSVDLIPLAQDGLRLGHDPIARFDYTADLLTTREEGAALAKVLGQRPIALLRNHGASIYAESIAELALYGVFFENAARAFIQASWTGFGLSAPDPGDATTVMASMSSGNFVADNWAYLKRELARSERATAAAGG